MEYGTLTSTIWLLLSLGLLHYSLYFVLRRYQIDAFRERLFSLRDEMFRYAQEGNIAFDHPAYGYLRRNINAMIKGAPRHDPARLFIIWASIKLSGKEEVLARAHEEMDGAIAAVDEEKTRAHMDAFRNKMRALAALQLIRRSRLLMVLYVVIALIVLLKTISKRIHRVFMELRESLYDFIEQEARLRSSFTSGTVK